jgi:hypothetical protein
MREELIITIQFLSVRLMCSKNLESPGLHETSHTCVPPVSITVVSGQSRLNCTSQDEVKIVSGQLVSGQQIKLIIPG